jgi:hypothetical protein
LIQILNNGDGMLRILEDRFAWLAADRRSDREEAVAAKIAEEATSSVAAAIILGTTFAAMVLFALSHA